MKIEGRKEVNCNFCGSDRKSILYRLHTTPLVKYKDCGLIYRSMRLSDEEEIGRYSKNIVAGRSEESKFPEMRMKLFRSWI